MKICVTGANGQLGRAMQEAFHADEVVPLVFPEWNLASDDFSERLAAEHPDLVIHSAAHTDVDGCTRNPELAFQVNALGSAKVADACLASRAAMVQISTNEVFSGNSKIPYAEYDPTKPVNDYGRSKLAGERMAAQRLHRLFIVRTAWLYTARSVNFPAKILQRANQDEVLKVVTDEVSNPTYVPDLAEAISKLVFTGRYGVYHLVNEGAASRYQFCRAILDRTGFERLPVEPVLLRDFDRPSTPPAFTPLSNYNAASLGIRLRCWQDALDDYVEQIQL